MSDERAEIIRDAVLMLLEEVGDATPAEMARIFDVPVAKLRFHLKVLHAVGEIRPGPRRPGSIACTWRIAIEEEEEVDVIECRRSWVAAEQQGKVRRDSLVAALFGPTGKAGSI
ncbi:hypothetical protein [Pseudoduganella sp. R-34]|uniref:hypothetical protein n=1 Tax=unclassified Pseudoduganella TaxID=2637179 RepID=UPI003CEA7C43